MRPDVMRRCLNYTIHNFQGFAVHCPSCNVPPRGFWRWALSTRVGSHVLQGWAIDPNEIEICTRGDGSLHTLGAGAYAKVLSQTCGSASISWFVRYLAL